MDKIYFLLLLTAISTAGCIGLILGHNTGVDQALERVCVQTNGKYDFCQATITKTYSVSIPEKGKIK